MNIKHPVALSALIALTTLSCWGAAYPSREAASPDELLAQRLAESDLATRLVVPMEEAHARGDDKLANQLATLAIVSGNIEELTDDLILYIASFLDLKTLTKLAQTNWRLNSVIQSAPLYAQFQQKKTVLPELYPELFAEILAQVPPHQLKNLAPTNIKYKDEIERTIRREHPGVLELLTQHGGDAQAALFDAARTDKPWAIDYLVRQPGVNIDATNARGATPLMIAARNGLADVVTKLLNNGATIDAGTYDSGTALEAAVQAQQVEIVDQLLKAGANPNVGGGNYSLLRIATKYTPNAAIADLLRRAGGQNY